MLSSEKERIAKKRKAEEELAEEGGKHTGIARACLGTIEYQNEINDRIERLSKHDAPTQTVLYNVIVIKRKTYIFVLFVRALG